MTQKEFAKKFVKTSQAYWSMVLEGKRNLGYKRAQTVSGLLDTSVDLWRNPDAKTSERKNAWESFKKRMEK